MQSLLIKNADYLWTSDRKNPLLRSADVYIEDNEIIEIGYNLNRRADRIIDASSLIVMPGLVNTHHHMYQSIFKTLPGVQNKPLSEWINNVSALSMHITPEIMYYAAKTSMLELVSTGCTTGSDFMHVVPKNQPDLFDPIIQAAKDVGFRFQLLRGSMTKGYGNFPDDVCQKKDEILKDSERVIKKYHDGSEDSMIHIGLAACNIFSSDRETFEGLSELSDRYNVQMHTHLAEDKSEDDFSKITHGKDLLDYMKDVGWLNDKVVFVHCIYLKDKDLKKISESGAHISHCPVSNSRGESTAPIIEALGYGIKVGIGVDGSASNDWSSVLAETKFARLNQGARSGFTYLKPDVALLLSTLGGANVLGFDSGTLQEGKLADIAIFDPKKIGFAGSQDIVGSLTSCTSLEAKYTIINGKLIVDNYKIKDLDETIEKQNKNAAHVIEQAEEDLGFSLRTKDWNEIFNQFYGE